LSEVQGKSREQSSFWRKQGDSRRRVNFTDMMSDRAYGTMRCRGKKSECAVEVLEHVHVSVILPRHLGVIRLHGCVLGLGRYISSSRMSLCSFTLPLCDEVLHLLRKLLRVPDISRILPLLE